MTRWRVVLASASPARLRLLRGAGLRPIVRVSAIDENRLMDSLEGRGVRDVVQALADAKADDVLAQLGPQQDPTLVIAADSLFLVGDQIMGKPETPQRARQRLAELSGVTGQLLTGHTVTALTPDGPNRRSRRVVATTVQFSDLPADEMDAYVRTGEPLAVAGGFTLDGYGAPFISGVVGDPSNVIGLSLPALRDLAAEVVVFWPDLWTAVPAP